MEQLLHGQPCTIKPGDIVRFTSLLHCDLGLGLVLAEKLYLDDKGNLFPGHFVVLTSKGQKIIYHSLMEAISLPQSP